jgi:hypothetical protein
MRTLYHFSSRIARGFARPISPPSPLFFKIREKLGEIARKNALQGALSLRFHPQNEYFISDINGLDVFLRFLFLQIREGGVF